MKWLQQLLAKLPPSQAEQLHQRMMRQMDANNALIRQITGQMETMSASLDQRRNADVVIDADPPYRLLLHSDSVPDVPAPDPEQVARLAAELETWPQEELEALAERVRDFANDLLARISGSQGEEGGDPC